MFCRRNKPRFHPETLPNTKATCYTRCKSFCRKIYRIRRDWHDPIIDPFVYPGPGRHPRPRRPHRLRQPGQPGRHGLQSAALHRQTGCRHPVRLHRHHGRCPEQPVGRFVQHRQPHRLPAGRQGPGRRAPLRPRPVRIPCRAGGQRHHPGHRAFAGQGIGGESPPPHTRHLQLAQHRCAGCFHRRQALDEPLQPHRRAAHRLRDAAPPAATTC